MTRPVSQAVQEEIIKNENRPIHLVVIELDSVTLRYTDHDQDVIFPDPGGDVYQAKGMSFDPISTDLSMEVDRVEIRLDNVDRSMSNLLASYEFQGRWCTIMKTFTNLLGDASNVVTLFSGRMYHPRVNEKEFVITVTSLLNSLNKRGPKRLFQAQCPWDFGGEECGLDITVSPYRETGTAEEGSTDSVLADSNRTEDENWWRYGILKMTSGANAGIRREVKASAPGQIEVLIPFPTNISPGDSYEIQVGCKKTLGECRKYGNTDNFGGFPSVTRRVSSL